MCTDPCDHVVSFCCVYSSRPHQCCCCCTHIGAGKDVTYYVMAAGKNWEDHHVLKEVKIQKEFSWAQLTDDIIKDNRDKLPGDATLITSYHGPWMDIKKYTYSNPPKALNIIAVMATGELERDE
eukprot:GHVU01114243.1.p1 GENE.GHVU01114243.1~~GHVU01114243.1.p1  ORF type:complete len:124 (-),score=11.34 GHVU01114243.1:43-414(-)